MIITMHSILKCLQKNIRTIKLKYNCVYHCTITPTTRHGTYTVEPVEERDVENIVKMLRKTFYIHEPMNAAVGLISSEHDTCPDLDEYCRSSLLEGLSFKAVTDSTDKIVGVSISGISPLDTSKDFLARAEKTKNPKLQKIMYVIAHQSEAARLWEKYPQDPCLVEVKISATDPEWQRRGIMNALVTRAVQAAERRKIRLVRRDATSAYTAMSAKKLGFKCVHKSLYTDIKKDGKPIIVPAPPHLEFGVYIKELCE